VAVIVAMAWAFRRSVARFWRARAAARSLQVLDVLPLGGKRQLTVVRCYDRTFVLGLGERDVSLVAEIDPVSVEATPAEPPPDFDDLIERAHQRLRRDPVATSRGAHNGVREPFSEVVA
jgi:flagellar biogenesis protein FliO